MEKQTAEQALDRLLHNIRKWSGGAHPDKKVVNEVTARNVLHEDLGRFSDVLPSYDLDQDTQDRLLVHTREDAAYSLLNTISMMAEIDELKRTIRRLVLGVWIAVIVSMSMTSFIFLTWKSR